MLGVQLADLFTITVTQCTTCRLDALEHLVETSASCTPSIKLSTKESLLLSLASHNIDFYPIRN